MIKTAEEHLNEMELFLECTVKILHMAFSIVVYLNISREFQVLFILSLAIFYFLFLTGAKNVVSKEK